jgi:hypothetical protein
MQFEWLMDASRCGIARVSGRLLVDRSLRIDRIWSFQGIASLGWGDERPSEGE